MTKTLQRPLAAAQGTLRPTQVVRVVQFRDRTAGVPTFPFALPISTGSDVSGWDSYDNDDGTKQYFASVSRYYLEFQQSPSGGVADWCMPVDPGDGIQITGSGTLRVSILWPTSTLTAKISAVSVRLLDAFPPSSGSWSATWDIVTSAPPAQTLETFTLDLSSPDSTTGTVDLSQTVNVQFLVTITDGTSVWIQVVDPIVYADPGSPGSTGPTREFYLSEIPIAYRYRSVEPIAFDARITDIADVSEPTSNQPDWTGQGLRQSLRLEILNHPNEVGGADFAAYLTDGWAAQGALVEVGQVNLMQGENYGDSIAALPSDSHEVWFRGRVRGLGEIDEASFVLECDAAMSPLQSSWLGPMFDGTAGSADPIDTGKRYDVALGVATDIPLAGLDVPAYTTLAVIADADAVTLTLTDASGFPSSPGAGYKVLIGDEVVTYTGKNGNQLTGVTRNVNASVRHANPQVHGIGETVIELGTDSTVWTWGGVVAELLTTVRIRNGIADNVLVAGSNRWTALADTVTITGAQLRDELRDLVTQGRALTQQVTEEAASPTTTNEYPTNVDQYDGGGGSTPSDATTLSNWTDAGDPLDNSPPTTFTRVGGNNPINGTGYRLIEIQFGSSGSNLSSASFGVFWDYNEGVDPLVDVYSGQLQTSPGSAVKLGTLDETPEAPQWKEFALPISGGTLATEWVTLVFNESAGDSEDNWSDGIYQVRRRRTNTTPGTVDLTEAAAAVSVGQGLKLHGTATMHVKNAGDTAADLYPLTTEGEPVLALPDVVRWIMQTRLFYDTRLVSEGGQLDDASWAIADAELGSTIVDASLAALGGVQGDPEAALSRLCWEFGAQLNRYEAVDRTVWRLDVPSLVGVGASQIPRFYWPTPGRAITEWESISRRSIDPSDLFNSEAVFLYDWHYPRAIGDVEGFRGVVTMSDAGQTVAARGSQWRIGLVSADDRFAFLSVSQQADAERTAAYYIREGIRDFAQVYQVNGVPWVDAYDLVRGDLVTLVDPHPAGPGHIVDPFDYGVNDATYGGVMRNAGDAGGGSNGYYCMADLSGIDSLALEVWLSSAWATSIQVRLASDSFPTNYLGWNFAPTNTVPAVYSFDLSAPDSTVGSGADLSRIGLVYMEVTATSPGASDFLYFRHVRQHQQRRAKCRVVNPRRNLGSGRIDLTLVEVP